MAEEKAVKAECIEKCREAAKQIKEIGLDAVLKKLSDKDGEFVWKDSYVFCFNDTKILAHPVSLIVGMSTSTIRDSNGLLYMKEMIDLATAKGDGWVNYMYVNRKSSDPNPQPKTSYVLHVPEEQVFLGAGIFE
ncbi:cache domain-containing protein [Desulfospira joergensenii]|uniref:cache domain-containing protein n=1 Tax=Desulfospira joergensenii TaxID=53329 RepID=UPI001376FA36|nr:cache domain-containing protein [Desulfospira joergensenii]